MIIRCELLLNPDNQALYFLRFMCRQYNTLLVIYASIILSLDLILFREFYYIMQMCTKAISLTACNLGSKQFRCISSHYRYFEGTVAKILYL